MHATLDPRNARAQLDLAVSYVGLGDVELETNARLGAEYFRKALDVVIKLLRESPENFSYLRRQEIYLTKLGAAELKLGDRVTALRHLRQAQEVLIKLTTRDPADMQVKGDQHGNLRVLAELHLLTGEHETALGCYSQMLALAEQSVALSRKDLYARWRLAEAYAGLARCDSASLFKLSVGEQAARQQQICEWRRKELTVWNEWSKLGVSSVFDQTRQAQAAQSVAECEAKLNRLTSGSHRSPD